MDEYTAETYGERIAAVYDKFYADYDPAAISILSELAGTGKALELGIGTGRIALPLHDMGVDVSGIDASNSMVAGLRSKPGGERISISMGNFADVAVEGEYSLIYIVFNTFFALLTQDEQVKCFQNVACRLNPGGVFLIEAFVPDLTRFDKGQTVRATRIEMDLVQLDVSEIETEAQLITAQHVLIAESGTRLFPVKIRYAWPAEMDLMARLCQLTLKYRWSDWHKSPFSSSSSRHISVYEKGS